MAMQVGNNGGTNGKTRMMGITPLEPLILRGSAEDELIALPDGIVQATITSPPYYRQKDYGAKNQLGWEATVEEYVGNLKRVFEHLLRRHGAGGNLLFRRRGHVYKQVVAASASTARHRRP